MPKEPAVSPEPETNAGDPGALAQDEPIPAIIGETAAGAGENPSAEPVNLPSLNGEALDQASPNGSGITLLLDVPLHVSVELGRTRLTIAEVLALRLGSVLELDKLAGEPGDVLVNGTMIARGEVVVVDEKFGIRITEVAPSAKRLASLG